MTIRDFLKRRTQKLAVVAILGWIICAMTPLVMRGPMRCRLECDAIPSRVTFPITIAVGLPLFAGGMLGMVFFLRCPQCSGRLSELSVTLVTPARYTRVMNFCPYCGVSIDEKMVFADSI